MARETPDLVDAKSSKQIAFESARSGFVSEGVGALVHVKTLRRTGGRSLALRIGGGDWMTRASRAR